MGGVVTDPFGYHPGQFPVLDGSRENLARARRVLDRLDVTPAERTALLPALRRRAVLDAAQGHGGTSLHIGVGIGLLVLLLAAPLITRLATRPELDLTGALLAYVWYLPCLVAWLLAAAFAALIITQAFDSGPRWLISIAVLVFAAIVTAGLVLLFGRLRGSDSSLLTAFFAAWLFITLTALVLVVEVPLAEERERRRYGALGINASAALVLLEEWRILVEHRRNWRTGAGRRDLGRRLTTLAREAETQLERSARANHGDGQARLWAEAYLVRLTGMLREHRHQLLLIDQRSQYDELVRRVRSTAVELAHGRWGSVDATGLQPRLTFKRRLLRFLPALLLGLAALLAGYIPGIDQENLLTIRLTLVIPAILSLLKVGELSQSTLGDTLREAADKVKG